MSEDTKKSSNEGFHTKWGFLLAAMGSAIGLGNIWRYPVVAYENGGGAFLIPYLVAIFTAGIPLLILEFNLGNKFRGSAPLTFKKLHPKLEFIGWLQTFICFIIPIFYSAVIAWLIYYTFNAINLGWGSNPEAFYYDSFLQISAVPESVFGLGGINWLIAGLITAVWVITLAISLGGVHNGIERVNKIMVPSLLVMFAIVVIYSCTLPGASVGLQKFFQPQWSSLTDPKIWLAAYGQVFFSTSIAAGIMITYSSYTPKGSDLNTNAVITGLGNSSVELAAGFGVFAALGFLATASGVGVDDVVTGGPGLVFTVYPSILNNMPMFGGIIGLLFYVSLLFAGFSSLISVVEVVIASIKSKFAISRTNAVLVVGIPLFVLSLLIGTRSGLYLLDIFDYYLNTLMWIPSGLIEIVGIILVVVILKRTKDVLCHGNLSSKLHIPATLEISLLSITAILLSYFTIKGVFDTFKQGYGSYPSFFTNFWGLGMFFLGIIIIIIMTLIPWHHSKRIETEEN